MERERGKESLNGDLIALVKISGDNKSFDVEFMVDFGDFGGNFDVFGGNGGRKPAIFSPFSLLTDAFALDGISRERGTGSFTTLLNSGFENSRSPPKNCDFSLNE